MILVTYDGALYVLLEEPRRTAPRGKRVATGASASPPGQAVDVTAVLDALSVKRSEKLNEKLDWRNSTADLMKVLAVESNLQARQELAKELQYEGDMKNSAATDCWLHSDFAGWPRSAGRLRRLPELKVVQVCVHTIERQ